MLNTITINGADENIVYDEIADYGYHQDDDGKITPISMNTIEYWLSHKITGATNFLEPINADTPSIIGNRIETEKEILVLEGSPRFMSRLTTKVKNGLEKVYGTDPRKSAEYTTVQTDPAKLLKEMTAQLDGLEQQIEGNVTPDGDDLLIEFMVRDPERLDLDFIETDFNNNYNDTSALFHYTDHGLYLTIDLANFFNHLGVLKDFVAKRPPSLRDNILLANVFNWYCKVYYPKVFDMALEQSNIPDDERADTEAVYDIESLVAECQRRYDEQQLSNTAWFNVKLYHLVYPDDVPSDYDPEGIEQNQIIGHAADMMAQDVSIEFNDIVSECHYEGRSGGWFAVNLSLPINYDYYNTPATDAGKVYPEDLEEMGFLHLDKIREAEQRLRQLVDYVDERKTAFEKTGFAEELRHRYTEFS